jgi:hypothetical protein
MRGQRAIWLYDFVEIKARDSTCGMTVTLGSQPNSKRGIASVVRLSFSDAGSAPVREAYVRLS